MYLEQIKETNDIKKIEKKELPLLAEEIREFLVENISRSGGHLASNLGTVELTMALHLEYQLPEDKIIWDVGHQSYTHKILTGRKDGFDHLRAYGGLSGFPKTRENPADAFNTGHSSTSISAGLGLVRARDILKKDYKVVSVIGDGSLTGGMAYEAINNATQLDSNFVIVINDNNMSISENVGGISRLLNNLRTADAYVDLKNGVTNALEKIPVYGDKMVTSIRKTKFNIKKIILPGNDLAGMGITYFGPIDGHNIAQLRRVFKVAKDVQNGVIVHVITKKGKGYEPAERHPSRFHGAEPFQRESGLPVKKKEKADYTDIFSTVMCKLGEREERVVAITAAMPDGTGLKRFANKYPERFFDVGIAEGHAVTFAAGMAKEGLRPVVAIYYSFLQRGYDQILHDVCMQNLPVIFAIDRAGLVGSDGETHQGAFDLSYLSMLPNMTVLTPKNKWELSDMMKFALRQDGPVAIRYPRGTAYDGLEAHRAPVEYGKSEVLFHGEKTAVLAVGACVKEAEKACEQLKEESISPTLVNVRFVKPLDEELIESLAARHTHIITVEDNVISGGYGEHVAAFLKKKNLPVKLTTLGIPDRFIEQGSVDILYELCGMNAKHIAKRIKEGAGNQS